MAVSGEFATAVHVLAGLAVSPGGHSRSNEIAQSVNTNPVVVRRILSKLNKAGLIRTFQGKAGGAQLAQKPERISLLDIYSAIGEPPIFGFNQAPPNRKCPLSCRMKAVLEPVFESAEGAALRELGRLTLAQIVQNLDVDRM